MSQRNKIKQKEDGRWYATGRIRSESYPFGGIFRKEPEDWRGNRFPFYSVIRLWNNGVDARPKNFRKFRHAKKCLSKWVNP